MLNGGYPHFRECLGIAVSEHEKFISKQCSYFNKRGKKSEILVERMILDYCKRNGLPSPEYNKKFSDGTKIEFVCKSNKRIGIDVTNTKKNAFKTIQRSLKERNIMLFLMNCG